MLEVRTMSAVGVEARGDEVARGIGRALRRARLARGEDLARIARDRLIPADHLAALERGALEEVPGLPYKVAIVRAYGNHLGLDGAGLAEPLQAALWALAPPGPEPRRRTDGSRRGEAVTVAAWLLLTAAASAGYYALHRFGPTAVEAVVGAAPPVADPPSRTARRWRADDAPPAAPTPAAVPGSEIAVDAAVPSGGEPPAGGVAGPEPVGGPVAAPPDAEAAPVPRAETSGDGPGASADTTQAPDGSAGPTPDAAAAPGGGSPAPGGDRTDATRPADPGSAGPSPDASIGVAKESAARDGSAPLGVPEPPTTAAGPDAASPARTGAAPPVADPSSRGGLGRADDALPTAPAPAAAPGPAAAAAAGADAAVWDGGEPIAGDIADPAPPRASEPVAASAEPSAVSPARTTGAPPAGRFLIYFHSVRPPDRVASEWRRLTERHPDLAGLEPRAPRPVEVPGEGTFYRVEAGAFATRAEAQAVCDRLRSRGQSCRTLTR